MNEPNLVEIMQKRTTQLTFLSAVLLGLMAVFLVSSLVQQSNAYITAAAIVDSNQDFDNVKGELQEGAWIKEPRLADGGVGWATKSTSFGGPEEGSVTANVGQIGKVEFYFNNPTIGPNYCETKILSGKLTGDCYILPGSISVAVFQVHVPKQQPESSYCNYLDKFGGEQTKIIRENLPLPECE